MFSNESILHKFMSRQKFRIHNTDLDNLTSNLRGEVGEIIFSWVLFCKFKEKADSMYTDDINKDAKNEELSTYNALAAKLKDEMIARLSELAEQKIGQLTFYFAQMKLNQFETEVKQYSNFIEKNRFKEKRNSDISHKELPEKWSQHKRIFIAYKDVVIAIVLAIRIMKIVDRAVLGPSAPHLWREMRRRRYTVSNPAKAAYMLLPYLRLNELERAHIFNAELEEGRRTWEEAEIQVNGISQKVQACKAWGIIELDSKVVVLPHYPMK